MKEIKLLATEKYEIDYGGQSKLFAHLEYSDHENSEASGSHQNEKFHN